MMDLLEIFARAGVLSPLDVHLAMSMGRLGEEARPEVLLGVALASRSPRRGHICADLSEIHTRVQASDPEIALPWPDPEAWIAMLKQSPLVRGRDSDQTTPLVLDGPRLYLDRYWHYQHRLAQQLRERARPLPRRLDTSRIPGDLDRIFGPARAGELDRQRLAALVAMLRPLSLITGGPGTGKTTTVAAILALLVDQQTALQPDQPLRIALAAPTGKAADRVGESIQEGLERLDLSEEARQALRGIQAQTLHKLLGWQPRSPTRFRHNSSRPLPHDVVIVDEASMVDLAMMSKLVDAVRPETRLIFLGDPDQLASVEAGAVLGDICAGLVPERPRLSREFAAQLSAVGGLDLTAHCEIIEETGIWDAVVQLTHTWRFGMDTGIGRLAVAVRRGQEEQARMELRTAPDSELERIDPPSDSALFEHPLPPALLETIVAAYAPAIQSALEGDARQALSRLSRLRVMAAHREGPLGLYAINKHLAAALARVIPGLNPGAAPWLGQPILVRENDAHLDLRNGQVGILVRGQEGSTGLVAAFADGAHDVRTVSISRLPRYESMLCMTIHQSQGSQFDHAVLILPSRSSPILTRELIYTGITQAQKRVSILSTEAILSEAIQARVQRASGLSAELWQSSQGAPDPEGVV